MSYTHAHYDSTGQVQSLCGAGESVRTGLTAGLLNTPVDRWPAPPFDKAVLLFAAGDLQWQDPRTAAQAWADVRAKRARLLAETDWMVARTADKGGTMATAWLTSPWKAYRQELRDLPQRQSDPFNIVWPTPPQG